MVGVLLASVVLALSMLAPAAQAASPKANPVKVMTRNLYLGADLTPAIAAGTPTQLAVAGTQIWNTVQATNGPARMKVMAKEIQAADPAIIGIQEGAKWFADPSNGIPGLPAPYGGPPSTTLVYDYVQSLKDELNALGDPYVEVGRQSEANLEGPTTLGIDIRLNQNDVILARKSSVDDGTITYSNVQSANYPHQLPFQLTLPLLGGLASVESTRGYVSADFVVNKRPFKFVVTHLEAFHPGVRAAQAQYLTTAGPAAAPGPVILAGDMNSDPNDNTANGDAFNALQAFGYTDPWPIINPGDPGFTSGFGELVNDPNTNSIDSRIDHVMTKGTIGVTKSKVTGLDIYNRTPAGLWPSDHAGVVTTLQP
jgi:endonuclease/exonuclease/phosphatase family metal-dependent hydrolase